MLIKISLVLFEHITKTTAVTKAMRTAIITQTDVDKSIEIIVCFIRQSTCNSADGIALNTETTLLVTPQFTQQMRRRDVVFASPDADVRHRLLILHQVHQTPEQLVVQAVW